jgi:hypothetical protein
MAARAVEASLRDLIRSGDDGIPPGYSDADPEDVVVGGTPSPGSENDGWSSATHVHNVPVGAPAGLANSNVTGSTGQVSDAGHQHKRDVRVQDAGGDVGTRNAVQFLAGSAISRSVVDNGGADRVEDTVAVLNPPGAQGDIWGHDGATPIQRGLGAAQNGNPLWLDTRHATRIAAGDAPNMPGFPWLGHWIRDDTLTNNVAFEVFRVAMPNDVDEWSGHVEYTAVGNDGTDQNKEVGGLRISAIRDSASVVTAAVGSTFGVLQHLPVGTITVTWSASVVGSDAIFSCTIDSSLAADVWLEFRLQADNNAQTVTFVQT